MYAVETAKGSRTYFHREMCGVYKNPLALAKECADKCGGKILVHTDRLRVVDDFGVDIYPRWVPL